MTYEEAMAWLDSLGGLGSVLGLNLVLELARRLGNPQNSVPMVHVAGTNGKGSVITYLEYVLRGAGYKTGKYISPSVMCYWEKIQINGECISKEAVADLVPKVKAACEAMVKEGFSHPTLFECETVMAFLYFREQNCGIALMETGMGGADDATNIMEHPVCEIITSVSMDHMGVLGDTLEEIAASKAGIIMPDTDVICCGGNAVVEAVVRKVAAENRARLRMCEPSKICNARISGFSQQFDYEDWKGLTIHLAGTHQRTNAATALEAVEVLKEAGFQVSEKAVRDGFFNARWPGRFECVCKNPLIVLDGAHNVDAAKRLKAAIEEYLPGKRLIFVMGIFRDKEYEKIIRLTNPLASEIITINSDNPRAIPGRELAEIVKKIRNTGKKDVDYAASPTEGIRRAVRDAGAFGPENAAIVAFGSLSFLGEIRRYIMTGNLMEEFNGRV